MITELLQPDLLLIKENGKLADQNDFFAALYSKQESWREPLGARFPPLEGKYSPNEGVGDIKINNLPEETWLEFQQFISDSYDTANSFVDAWQANLNATDYAFYLSRAGLTGVSSISTITASDGHVIATGIETPTAYQTKWNTLLVPYERVTLGNTAVQYRKYVYRGTTDNKYYFRRSTFNFDGTA